MPAGPSYARRGLDLLLATFPAAEVFDVTSALSPATSPWVSVVLHHPTGEVVRSYAIWRETGAVHVEDANGVVADDPFLVPEGSPYKGPVAPVP
jgi:hypothetical protein